MWHRIIAEVLFIKPKLLCYWAGHPLLWRIDLMAPSKKTPQHLSSWMLQQYPTSRNTGTNPGSFKYFWQILHTFLLIAYNVIWWMLLLNKDNRFYVKNEVPPFSLLLADIDWRYMSYLKLLLLLLPFFSFYFLFFSSFSFIILEIVCCHIPVISRSILFCSLCKGWSSVIWRICICFRSLLKNMLGTVLGPYRQIQESVVWFSLEGRG